MSSVKNIHCAKKLSLTLPSSLRREDVQTERPGVGRIWEKCPKEMQELSHWQRNGDGTQGLCAAEIERGHAMEGAENGEGNCTAESVPLWNRKRRMATKSKRC